MENYNIDHLLSKQRNYKALTSKKKIKKYRIATIFSRQFFKIYNVFNLRKVQYKINIIYDEMQFKIARCNSQSDLDLTSLPCYNSDKSVYNNSIIRFINTKTLFNLSKKY